MALLLSIIQLVTIIALISAKDIYVCESSNKLFLGKYTAKEKGTDIIYENNNGMSFFTNNKFWYLGDLTVWPPLTHYRCIDITNDTCNYGKNYPPLSLDVAWTVATKHGKSPVPTISYDPCPADGLSTEL